MRIHSSVLAPSRVITAKRFGQTEPEQTIRLKITPMDGHNPCHSTHPFNLLSDLVHEPSKTIGWYPNTTTGIQIITVPTADREYWTRYFGQVNATVTEATEEDKD